MVDAHATDGALSQAPSRLWGVALAFLLFTIGFRAGTLTAHPSQVPAGSVPLEADRGRLAATPSDIPAKGWKDILLRVHNNISEHRVVALAAGTTFYSLLAIFPALAALVAIYGVFSDPATITAHLDTVSGFLPGGANSIAPL